MSSVSSIYDSISRPVASTPWFTVGEGGRVRCPLEFPELLNLWHGVVKPRQSVVRVELAVPQSVDNLVPTGLHGHGWGPTASITKYIKHYTPNRLNESPRL
ncbi:hypothetical protein EKH57_04280 [Halorubrum sp. BOL3-1]|nr:hypothetical protein EKH57_04280 [Halorubrum sp. BOL3-1]